MTPATEIAVHAHTWIEIAIAICGFGGVGLTAWRTSLGVKNEVRAVKVEVEGLSKHVEKQNGKLGRAARRMRSMEVRCASLHGVQAVAIDEDDTEEEGI